MKRNDRDMVIEPMFRLNATSVRSEKFTVPPVTAAMSTETVYWLSAGRTMLIPAAVLLSHADWDGLLTLRIATCIQAGSKLIVEVGDNGPHPCNGPKGRPVRQGG